MPYHSQLTSHMANVSSSIPYNENVDTAKPPPKPILPPKLKTTTNNNNKNTRTGVGGGQSSGTMDNRYPSSSSSSSDGVPANLQETFVDPERTRTAMAAAAAAASSSSGLNRSASSVTSKSRVPIAKPVRRSKSQHFSGGKSYVTSIQHGGSVTLVSLSGGDDHTVHYNHDTRHHQPEYWTGGSHTLPRRKPNNAAPASSSGSTGNNGVKIRINSSAENSYEFDHHFTSNSINKPSTSGAANISQDTQTSLDFDPRRYLPAVPMTSSSSDQPKSGKSHRKQKKSTGSGNAAGGRRKLTLEELEMEGF